MPAGWCFLPLMTAYVEKSGIVSSVLMRAVVLTAFLYCSARADTEGTCQSLVRSARKWESDEAGESSEITLAVVRQAAPFRGGRVSSLPPSVGSVARLAVSGSEGAIGKKTEIQILTAGRKKYADIDLRSLRQRSPEAMSAWGLFSREETQTAAMDFYGFTRSNIMAKIDASAISAEAMFSTSLRLGQQFKLQHGAKHEGY